MDEIVELIEGAGSCILIAAVALIVIVLLLCCVGGIFLFVID